FGKKKNKPYFNPGNRSTGVSEHYVKEEVTKIEEGDVEVVLKNQENIDKKFSGGNSLSKYAKLGSIMMNMLKDIKHGGYKNIPWFTIATVVFALLYILNPLDVVPDFIPGLGYIDDVAVLTIGVGWIESDLHRYLSWKVEQGKGMGA
ncbi:MAG: YkvA family protein, partial [Marinirhabdus sp.]